jgi:uncharacterized protein (DUF433 family)
MLEQEYAVKFFMGYEPDEIESLVNIPMISITQTNFPNLEMAKFSGGRRAVLRNTRIPVSIVISYLLAGETPNTLVENVLPNITLAQVFDAIKYYSMNRSLIDEERRENTEDESRKFLRDSLGDDKYNVITGA